MKKIILTTAAVFFTALPLFMAGCDQPTEFNLRETDAIQSISGPERVKVSALTGALLVEWEPVTDAQGYEIRRKGDVKGAVYAVVGSVDNAKSKFLDIISDANILEDGKKYTYRVVAVSGLAPRTVVQSGLSAAEAFTGPYGNFSRQGKRGGG
ncbi:MAG: fibronectin type III domain-containing protein [Treponema sp.]|jgi:hypothetical protein|nr:fibronectin type III domain-containing protein [Treponema sp.]